MVRRLKLNIIEAGDGDSRLADASGNLNPHYFPHIQILAAPTNPSDEITAFAPSPFEKILSMAQQLIGQHGVLKKTWGRVVTESPKLWTPKRMSGAEYEGGRFESSVARMAVRSDLAATRVTVDVNYDVKVPLYEYREPSESTLRSLWQEHSGVELPEKGNATVYIIAPESKIAAAREFVETLAQQEREMSSHRGIGFNWSVAFAGLSAEEKEKLGTPSDGVAWFDVHNDLFFTTDAKMYQKFFEAMKVQTRIAPELANA